MGPRRRCATSGGGRGRELLSALLAIVSLLPAVDAGGPSVSSSSSSSSASSSDYACEPQAFARAVLGATGMPQAPLPFPTATAPSSAAPLPACGGVAGSCGCCGVRHALAVRRWLPEQGEGADAAGDEEEEDGGLSGPCRQALELVACRACDPRISVAAAIMTSGSGSSSGSSETAAVCPSLCDGVLAACSGDFFSVDEATGLAAPCGGGGGGGRVCSALGALASDGRQLCSELLGVPVASSSSSSSWCYDGSPMAPQEARRVCEGAAAAMAAAAAAAAKRRRRERGGTAAAASSFPAFSWRQVQRAVKRQADSGALLPPALALAAMLVVHLVLGRRGAGGAGGGRGGGGGGGGAGSEQAAARAAMARERLAEQLAAAAELRHRRADEALNS